MIPIDMAARVAAVHERIDAARRRAGRSDGVMLVAVTKTHPAEVIRAARGAGVTEIGENRVSELTSKVADVGRNVVHWHLIGHLQRNKVRRAIPLFDLLHSLDSLRLAEKLSGEAKAMGKEVRALVQVNPIAEESKGGFAPDEAVDAIAAICELPSLQIEGLMTMAPFAEEVRVLRRCFAMARRVWEEAAKQVPTFNPVHLSMGMSNDFEIAVEEGSTLVRVGTALFGERESP